MLSQSGEDTEAYTEMKRCNLAGELGQDWTCVKGCFYSRCLFSCDSSYQKHLGRTYSVTAYATITWILLSHSWGLFMRLREAIKKPTIIHGLSKISTRALLSHEDDKCVSNKDCSPLLQFQQFKMNTESIMTLWSQTVCPLRPPHSFLAPPPAPSSNKAKSTCVILTHTLQEVMGIG